MICKTCLKRDGEGGERGEHLRRLYITCNLQLKCRGKKLTVESKLSHKSYDEQYRCNESLLTRPETKESSGLLSELCARVIN